MKLSEAIRIGIQKSEPGRGQLIETNGVTKACALGCAGIGAGLSLQDIGSSNYVLLKKTFPELTKRIDSDELYNHIWKLNDRTQMTREEIADWVEAQGY